MDFPFGKKKHEPPPPPTREYIPVDIVQRYTSQGLSEPEIVARLQSHGFRPSQIDRALKMAIKNQVGTPYGPGPQSMGMAPAPPGPPGGREFRAGGPPGRPPQQMPPQQQMLQQRMERPPLPPEAPIEPVRQAPRPHLPAPPQREFIVPQSQGPRPMGLEQPQREIPMGAPPERIVAPGMGGPQIMLPTAPIEGGQYTFEKPRFERFETPETDITLEEVIEGVVAERWEDFEERLTMFEKRDIQLTQQIEDARKRIEEVQDVLKTKETNFSGKLDNFGDSVENIESRIGSIEKVFKEFLPELIENVKAMSEIVEKVKEK